MKKLQLNRLRVGIAAVTVLIALVVGGFFAYVGDYYRADDEVEKFIESDARVSVSASDGIMTFVPENIEAETGLVFYPGGKVEWTSYAPLMRRLAERGCLCFLVKMPFNLAALDQDAAEDIIAGHGEIENWYMAGHSLGGAMAANYAAQNDDLIDGLILLASYPASDISDSDIKVLSIYGSEDKVIDMDSLEKGRNYMPQDYKEVLIDGANHSQFGSYGKQNGDGFARISADEQQSQAVEEIVKFIAK